MKSRRNFSRPFAHFSEQQATAENPADKPADKPVDQTDKQAPPPAQDQPSNTASVDVEKLEPAVQKMIRDLRDENAKHRRDKQAAKEAADTAERQRLETAGEWQKVAHAAQTERNELKPYKERFEALEAILDKQVTKRIKELPEQFRKLVPEKYTTLEKLEWLEANAAAFQVKTAPNLDAGAGKQKAPGAQDVPDEARIKDVAQRFRLRIG